MSDTQTPVKKPYDNLNQAQTDRLKKLQSEIQFDKLTVSFSIEDRDQNGRKKSAFYSVTSSRGTGAEMTQMGEDSRPVGFSSKDVNVVRGLLNKHVIAATYSDAIRRGIIPRGSGIEEMQAILARQDDAIVRALADDCPPPSGEIK